MDPKINKIKKYINISKSSSEEIYAMLDEVESDLEEDIDQLFSYSLIIHEPNLQSDCWVWVMCVKFDTQ